MTKKIFRLEYILALKFKCFFLFFQDQKWRIQIEFGCPWNQNVKSSLVDRNTTSKQFARIVGIAQLFASRRFFKFGRFWWMVQHQQLFRRRYVGQTFAFRFETIFASKIEKWSGKIFVAQKGNEHLCGIDQNATWLVRFTVFLARKLLFFELLKRFSCLFTFFIRISAVCLHFKYFQLFVYI